MTKTKTNEHIDLVYHGCETDFKYIKYAIFSAHKYAKWINKIHVTYDDKEDNMVAIVKDIKTSGSAFKNVNFIPLSSFVPKEYLKNRVNKCMVESWIWRSKNVTNNFLYACNDMFFGRPTSVDEYFVKNKNGKLTPLVQILPPPIRHGMSESNIPYVKMFQNAIKKHDMYFTRFVHCALPHNKGLLRNYYNQFKKQVDTASLNNTKNCRAGEKEFNLLRIATPLMVMKGDAYSVVTSNDKYFFAESTEHGKWGEISKHKPGCFCINNLPRDSDELNAFLNKYYKLSRSDKSKYLIV